ASAPTGAFVNGSTIRASNNPQDVFTVSISGNSVILTLDSIGASPLIDVVNGQAVYYGQNGTSSTLSIGTSGGLFSIGDTGSGVAAIALTPAATAAGWVVNSGVASIPSASAPTALAFLLGDGTDTIASMNAGSATVSLSGSGTLNIGGAVTTTGTLSISD